MKNATAEQTEIETFELSPEQARLEPWFNKVSSSNDWKSPIKAFCKVEDMNITAEAIAFYTSTVASFESVGHGWLKVTADGYRRGPAGDH